MGFGAGASRAERKAKRRKLEDSIPDIPDDLETESNTDSVSAKRKRNLDDDANEEQIVDGNGEITKKNKESNHKSKKTKTTLVDITSLPVQNGELSDIAETEVAPKKSKKERKAERKAKEAAANATSKTQDTETAAKKNDPDTNAVGDSDQTTSTKKRAKNKKQGDGSGANAESKTSRFIVFVGEILCSESSIMSYSHKLLGNLPFTATTASIKNHFAAVKPASVRHLTEKGNPSKSRGCAFLEFEGYDHMKTCLKQFHQTTFNDGLSAPRKVNVELT